MKKTSRKKAEPLPPLTCHLKPYRSGNVCCTSRLPKPKTVDERLTHTRSALTAILRWASDKSGRSLEPLAVSKLCRAALEATK